MNRSAKSYLDAVALEHVPCLQIHRIVNHVAARGRLSRNNQSVFSRVAEQKSAARFIQRRVQNAVETIRNGRSVLQVEHERDLIVAEGKHGGVLLGLDCLERKGRSYTVHTDDCAVVLFIRQLVQNPCDLAVEIELSSHLEALPREGLLAHLQNGSRD